MPTLNEEVQSLHGKLPLDLHRTKTFSPFLLKLKEDRLICPHNMLCNDSNIIVTEGVITVIGNDRLGNYS